MATISGEQFIPGQVKILIDSKNAFTVENFGVQMTRASEVASGWAGNFARRNGVPQYAFSFEMPPRMKNGFEVDLATLETPHDWSYQIGDQVFTLTNAQVNSDDLSVAMQQGNTRCNFRGNALHRLPNDFIPLY